MTRLSAVQAASDALNELGVDQSGPIDPFEAIEDAGLVLSFRPLTDLLGAILPGPPAGVLINSARPPALQRYTAAHELGHWFMDRDALSLDTPESVLGDHGDAREVNAQVFAAHFLMPLELLHPTARRYGITRTAPTRPEQAYEVARDMHVSYEAAVRQMVTTRLVTRANAVELLRAAPAAIKRRLTDGMVLPHARGDVWIVEHPADNAQVDAFVGDAILLRLREHPSTGYRWCADTAIPVASILPFRPAPAPFAGERAFAGSPPASSGEVVPFPMVEVPSDVVTLLRDEVIRDDFRAGVTAVGGPVTRLVAYTATAPGQESIHLREIRPVRPSEPAARVEVTTRVRGLPEVEFRRRLLAAFAQEEAEADGWES
ncbi:ImmA/IrrE family metallo-endopeptidase [Cellulosimicrobium funkei]|uniref:ImmA/IrrE family metallo-endopeptidase n=1 Tax=Cellulosimicrobium funkei TaxID=264251 RepID=UPI003D728CC4